MPAPLACPACGMPRASPDLACAQCGAPAVGTDAARKSVAVLFADIAGSTSLIEGQDPETAHALLRPALDLVAACVRRFGGTVNRVTGDGVMALFGAPSAMEDHVLAACCAAVAMQAELPDAAPGIGLRVGLHAGEVLVHALHADGASGLDAAGDAVHLAARLQQAAEPGKILLSGTAARAAGARVTALSLPPMRLRGITAPVAASELTAVAPELTRLEAAGAATLAPFVGRSRELAILAEAMDAAVACRGSAIALSGEAGIGKSRLVREFSRQGPAELAVHEATCRRWREAVGFHPLRPLLRRMLLLDAATPAAEAQARIGAMQAAWPEPLRDADALAAVLDLPAAGPWRTLDPKARRRRMILVTVEMLTRLAEAGPVLLAVDDLHWADAETLSVLAALADRLCTLPMLLVLSWRPDFEDPLVQNPTVRVLALGSLDQSDATDLAARLLAGTDPAEAALLARRAAGNPLFIETQAAARREQGTAAPLPDSVRALLGARIDRAGVYEKRLIEAMATHGEPAPIELIAELAELPVNNAAEAAATLTARRLAVAEGVGAAAELACAHPLIQEVTYADMTRARRRVQHARSLHVLERRAGEAVEPLAETLARHARIAEDSPRLVRFARMAGRRAAARDANTEAVGFFNDALEALARLPGADPALAVDLRFDVRDPLFRLGRTAEVRTRLEEASRFADGLGDPVRQGQLAILLSHITWLSGDHAASEAAADRAAAIGAARNDTALAVRATFQHASIALARGQHGRAADQFAEVAARHGEVAPANRYGVDAPLAVIALCYGARALIDAGRLEEASARVEQAEALALKVNKPWTTAFARVTRGHWLDASGESDKAVPMLEEAVRLGEAAEAPLLEPVTTLFLGTALLHAGQAQDARRVLERSVASGQRIGFAFCQPLRLARLGAALAACGEAAAAAATIAEARAMAARQGEVT
ncbi:MAG: AAA family ATPase [Acetobacteraceae bacterium]|nr:AAA family ATPase [Acetobacteraceae bacterium]